MPDAYSQITTAKPAVVSVLIDAMELRAADPQQRVIRERFLNEVAFPDTARVLEAGCGSGASAGSSRGGPRSARWSGWAHRRPF